MIRIHTPTSEEIGALKESWQPRPFSYSHVGATTGPQPANFTFARLRGRIGSDETAFRRACQAIRNWQMMPSRLVRPGTPLPPIEPGQTVTMALRSTGFCAIVACRIVYVVADGATCFASRQMPNLPLSRKFGFAYGTLRGHFECGEERFIVEFDEATGQVDYEVASFSRAGNLLGWLGQPLIRRKQAQFRAESLLAMQEAARS